MHHDLVDLEDPDSLSAMYGIMPHADTTRSPAAVPRPGAKHAAAHRRTVAHKPRMPTSLERKLQDARVQLYKQLGVPGDPQRPTSPGTLHRLLARMHSRSQSGTAGGGTKHSSHRQHASSPAGQVSLHMPGSSHHTDSTSCSAKRPGMLLSSVVPAEQGKLQGQAAATSPSTAPQATQNITTLPAQGTAGPAQGAWDAAWSAGRGRISPHINFSLSILPTATEDLARDKTLYYSPIGGLAGTTPHQFANTLREPGGMLMYSTPQQKTTILGQWDKVDAKLQQQLLDAALSGPKVQALQQQDAAGVVTFESWMYGPEHKQDPVSPTVHRVHQLAQRMQVHPNALWELLGPAYEQQAKAGISELPDDGPPGVLQGSAATGSMASEFGQDTGLKKSVSYAPGCIEDSKGASQTQHGATQRLPGIKLVKQCSRTGSSRKIMLGVLRHAPAGVPYVHASASRVLKAACQQSAPGLMCTGTSVTQDVHDCKTAADSLQEAVGIAVPAQAPSTVCDGMRSQLPEVLKNQTSPLPSPRHRRKQSPHRAASPPQQPALQSTDTQQAAQRTSPHQLPSVSLEQPHSDVLDMDVVGRISHRYVDAAKRQEWQPWVAGVVRPSTGESWDYHTGVYDKRLADELAIQQLVQPSHTATSVPHSGSIGVPNTSIGVPHSHSRGGKFATRSPWLLAFTPDEAQTGPGQKLHNQQGQSSHARQQRPQWAQQKAQHAAAMGAAVYAKAAPPATAPAVLTSDPSIAADHPDTMAIPSKQALRKMVGRSVLRWCVGQQHAAAGCQLRRAASSRQHTGEKRHAVTCSMPAAGGPPVVCGAASMTLSLASSRHTKTQTAEASDDVRHSKQVTREFAGVSDERGLAAELITLAGQFNLPAEQTPVAFTALTMPYASLPSIVDDSKPHAGMLAALDASSAADKERDRLAASKARLQGSAVPHLSKEAPPLQTHPYTSMYILSQLQESRQVQQQLLAVERDLTPLIARQRQEQARKMGAC